MLPHRGRAGLGRDVLRLSAIVLRVRAWFGYVPNVEWLRVQLSRAILFDCARAHAAIVETERCLRLRASGGWCRRFAEPVR